MGEEDTVTVKRQDLMNVLTLAAIGLVGFITAVGADAVEDYFSSADLDINALTESLEPLQDALGLEKADPDKVNHLTALLLSR